ncbi:polymer-forming cytoskeletal protein [Roseibium sp. RKSG952]|uniref:polymer-forming cytoskeletal protein n=1 Tax=Roseibium sp. RKSG952 TaxID=2529384 RepID=UPI0012BCB4F0|nr:polymer-forming cytoskeletal protein [Roseibium sp. RKSG952]MTH95313.1 polymer-forming cytoskeletal protein [Roseibium sp. RKSG952]
MDTHFDIDKPGERLVLRKSLRGNVRCKILQVERGVSLVGNVKADEVFMAGSFFGHLETNILRVGVHASLRGNLTYERLNMHPSAKPLNHGFLIDEKKFAAELVPTQASPSAPATTPSPPDAPVPTEKQTVSRVLRLNF